MPRVTWKAAVRLYQCPKCTGFDLCHPVSEGQGDTIFVDPLCSCGARMMRVEQPLLLRANFRSAYHAELARIRDLEIELSRARLRASALHAECYALDAGAVHA